MANNKLTDLERQEKARLEAEHIKKHINNEKFNKTEHYIVFSDSKKMDLIKNNSINLIITSPPYYNAREYSQWNSLEEYLQDMKLIFKECLRVLSYNRKFCLNISDLPEKGESGVRWIPLGPELLKVALEIGFELCDRIIWFKTPIKGFQYGSLPYPPSPLICDSMEYIYILRKPGKPNYNHLSKEQKEASKLAREEYSEFTKQIWTMKRVRLKENIKGHIAPFPDELPHRCIKLYSFVGEWILDPFGGSGTTTKMAIENKRNSYLYEINKSFKKHIDQKLNLEQNSLYDYTKIQYINEK